MTENVWAPPSERIRERYRHTTTTVKNRPGTWDSTLVKVYRGETQVAEYLRHYAMMRTFEPFQQWDGERWHEYALISPEYTRTSVLDLESGEVVAEEEPTYYDKERTRPGAGFCPVAFHVPDWWDVNDGSILPGDEYWEEHDKLPSGTFGFVAGCHWGDDSSWKVQYLDLSRVREGKVSRDDRFGYVELPAGIRLKDAVQYRPESNAVELAVAATFAVETGEISEWSLEGLTDPRMRHYRRAGESEE